MKYWGANNQETIPAQGEILTQALKTDWRVGYKFENSDQLARFLVNVEVEKVCEEDYQEGQHVLDLLHEVQLEV